MLKKYAKIKSVSRKYSLVSRKYSSVSRKYSLKGMRQTLPRGSDHIFHNTVSVSALNLNECRLSAMHPGY